MRGEGSVDPSFAGYGAMDEPTVSLPGPNVFAGSEMPFYNPFENIYRPPLIANANPLNLMSDHSAEPNKFSAADVDMIIQAPIPPLGNFNALEGPIDMNQLLVTNVFPLHIVPEHSFQTTTGDESRFTEIDPVGVAMSEPSNSDVPKRRRRSVSIEIY
jgi:hypothetical protein